MSLKIKSNTLSNIENPSVNSPAASNLSKAYTPSELSRKLKSQGAFGIRSDHGPKPKSEVDQSGGDIRHILNYQYERDYLSKARQLDSIY